MRFSFLTACPARSFWAPAANSRTYAIHTNLCFVLEIGTIIISTFVVAASSFSPHRRPFETVKTAMVQRSNNPLCFILFLTRERRIYRVRKDVAFSSFNSFPAVSLACLKRLSQLVSAFKKYSFPSWMK